MASVSTPNKATGTKKASDAKATDAEAKRARIDLLFTGAEKVVQAFLTKSIGAVPAQTVASVARSLAETAVDSFGGKSAKQAEIHTATLFEKVKDASLKAIGDAVTQASSNPEFQKDAQNLSELSPKKPYTKKKAGGVFEVLNDKHLINALLKALKVDPKNVPAGINAGIEKTQEGTTTTDLRRPEDQGTAYDNVLAGILRDNKHPALAALLELGGITLKKVAQRREARVEQNADGVDPQTPKAPESGAPHVSKGVGGNVAASFLGKMAYGQNVGKMQDLVQKIIGDFGLAKPPPQEEVDKLVKALMKAFHGLDGSKLDRQQVVAPLLKICSDSVNKTVTEKQSALEKLEKNDKAKPKEITAAKEALTLAQRQKQGWLGNPPQMPGLADFIQHMLRLSPNKGTPEELDLNVSLGTALEHFVANNLGVALPDSKAFGALLQRLAGHISGLKLGNDRAEFEAKHPGEVFAPSLQFEEHDIKNQARSYATRVLADEKGEADPAAVNEVAKVLETIVPKAKTNVELIAACIAEIKKRAGITDDGFPPELNELFKTYINADPGTPFTSGLVAARAQYKNATELVSDINASIAKCDAELQRLATKDHDPELIKLAEDRTKTITQQQSVAAELKDFVDKIAHLDGHRKLKPIYDRAVEIARLETQIAKLKETKRPSKALTEAETKLKALKGEAKKKLPDTFDEYKKKRDELEGKKTQFETRAGELKKTLTDLDAKLGKVDPKHQEYIDLKGQQQDLNREFEELKKLEPNGARAQELKTQLEALEEKLKKFPKNKKLEDYTKKRLDIRFYLKAREGFAKERDQHTPKLLEFRDTLVRLENGTNDVLLGGGEDAGMGLIKMMSKAIAENLDTKQKKETNEPPAAPKPPSSVDPLSAKKRAKIEERVRLCAAILANPTLDTQTKILYFLMMYASGKKEEQEEDLKEINQAEARRASWSQRKAEHDLEINAQESAVKNAETAVQNARDAAKKPPEQDAEGKDIPRPDAAAIKALEKQQSTAQDMLDKMKMDSIALDAKPEARNDREQQMMLLERGQQEYDHLLRMCDSLIQRYDRLIDQILRSMSQ